MKLANSVYHYFEVAIVLASTEGDLLAHVNNVKVSSDRNVMLKFYSIAKIFSSKKETHARPL